MKFELDCDRPLKMQVFLPWRLKMESLLIALGITMIILIAAAIAAAYYFGAIELLDSVERMIKKLKKK
ncbi:MAG: hypothetical protein ACI8Z1_001036 [Candidatus Azotimanducaceae bacterium]|jgi:hypothetical protein